MLVWYVHGAGASSRSFNWLSKQLPQHKAKFLSYDVNEQVSSVCERFLKLIDEPCIILGHSLGGIISTLVADHPCVQKIITICAPFGGIPHAGMLSLLTFDPFFFDLISCGPLLTAARNKSFFKPHLAIAGTKGLPYILEPNDGVLTVDSQTARPDTKYALFSLNHFEVLLSSEVVALVSTFI